MVETPWRPLHSDAVALAPLCWVCLCLCFKGSHFISGRCPALTVQKGNLCAGWPCRAYDYNPAAKGSQAMQQPAPVAQAATKAPLLPQHVCKECCALPAVQEAPESLPCGALSALCCGGLCTAQRRLASQDLNICCLPKHGTSTLLCARMCIQSQPKEAP